jgi:choline monooxygenase
MSPAYYTSPECLEVEKDELFRKEWICIGHEVEIPRCGDCFTTELVGEQLVVIRD